jgi:hypothetical protein
MPTRTDESITTKDLLELLPKIIEEARKPVPDPAEEARKAEAKRRWEATLKAADMRRAEAEARCAHSVMYNGTRIYKILWNRNSDGFYRGVCSRCRKVFSPEKLSRTEYAKWVEASLDISTAAAAPVQPHAHTNKQADLAANWK